ncbi:SIR2 family protein, partial [Tunturiibacter gelidoferens]
RYFLGYDRAPARLNPAMRRKCFQSVDVEEVFTFLSERSRAPSTSTALKTSADKIWAALVSELPSVFNRFGPNQSTRAIYKKLVQNFLRKRDTVVSFNYDTVFERSLPKNFRWHYESIQDGTSSLRVLKPHGSINWEDSNPIRVTKEPERALIVAPTHLKFIQTGHQSSGEFLGYLDHSSGIEDVWRLMEKEMRDAKALVFIGYSFPLADLYFSSILRSVLTVRDGAPAVVIVNPDAVNIAKRLQGRFALKNIERHFDIGTFVEGSRKNLLNRLNGS